MHYVLNLLTLSMTISNLPSLIQSLSNPPFQCLASLPDINQGAKIIIATAITTAAALITVLARFYMRVRLIHNVGWDDYTMALSGFRLIFVMSFTMWSNCQFRWLIFRNDVLSNSSSATPKNSSYLDIKAGKPGTKKKKRKEIVKGHLELR